MLEPMTERSRSPLQPIAPALGLQDCEILAPLFEINARTLHLLARLAADSGRPPLQLAEKLRDLLRALDEAALRRAAMCPLMLVEIKPWDVPESPVRTPEHIGQPDWLPQESAIRLMRSAITLAWHVARSYPQTAGIRLGLPAAAVLRIRELQLHELEVIAEEKFSCLRPRWEWRVDLWRSLLLGGRVPQLNPVNKASLQALHLIVSDLTSSSTTWGDPLRQADPSHADPSRSDEPPAAAGRERTV